MRKIITIFAAAMTVCGCQKECGLLHDNSVMGYPVLEKGTFPTEAMTVPYGTSIQIRPVLKHPEEARFEWYLGKRLISEESSLDYTFDNIYDGKLTCKITNGKGAVRLSVPVRTDHDFTRGYFIVLRNDISFYNTEKKVRYDHVLSSLNDDTVYIKDKYTDIAGVVAEGDTFSLVLRHSATNIEHLHIFDFPSMKHRVSSIVSANIHCVMATGDSYALLATQSGLVRADLISGFPTFITAKGCPFGKSLFGGAAVNGDKVFFSTFSDSGSAVRYASRSLLNKAGREELEDSDFKETGIIQTRKTGMTVSDGKVVTLFDTEGKSGIAFIGNDLSVEKVLLDFRNASGKYWSSPTVNFAAGNGGELYIQAEDGNVYRHQTGKTELFASSETHAELRNISGGIYRLTDGNIAVTYGVSDFGNDNGGLLVFSDRGEMLYKTEFENHTPISILEN